MSDATTFEDYAKQRKALYRWTSDLFWIGRNINMEVGLLREQLLTIMPPEEADKLLLGISSIGQILIGSL